jgi:hypothetical protein
LKELATPVAREGDEVDVLLVVVHPPLRHVPPREGTV